MSDSESIIMFAFNRNRHSILLSFRYKYLPITHGSLAHVVELASCHYRSLQHMGNKKAILEIYGYHPLDQTAAATFVLSE